MKTWIVVLVLAVCCVALLAQSTRPATSQPRASQPARFQIVINPAARADTFLLDTATGTIWQRTKYTDLPGQPEIWQIQDRADSQVDLLAWAADRRPKPPAPPESPASEDAAAPQPEWTPAPQVNPR